MAKVTIPNFKLNNGMEIPALGFGTWLGLDDKAEFQAQHVPQLLEALLFAVDVGYRHFDTAHLYRVEPELGAAVRRKIGEGVVRREDIFITTKVWQHNHRPADVVASVRASLQRMGLDYVDLALMHWPMSIDQDGADEKIDYLETYRGLEAAHAAGLARAVGVSNFNMKQMRRLLDNCKVKPVANQIQVNLNLLEKELVSFCQAQDVLVVSYSSFGAMTKLYQTNSPEPKLDNPVLTEMAQKYGKTVTQIVLRYLYQQGMATIPKSLTKSRILENASIFDFDIDKNDVATLERFDCGFRSDCPRFWQHYANYPFERDAGAPDAAAAIPLSLRRWRNGANLDIE